MTILCGEISAFMETFFFVYFHKDDIVPDLADTFPGNDIFIITSEQAAESSGAWKYKGGELTAFAVKFRIKGHPRLRQVQILITSFALIHRFS